MFTDPYIYASVIYSADNGIMGWTDTDVAAWNSLREYLLSGPVTSVVLKSNGVILVTINGSVREF